MIAPALPLRNVTLVSLPAMWLKAPRAKLARAIQLFLSFASDDLRRKKEGRAPVLTAAGLLQQTEQRDPVPPPPLC